MERNKELKSQMPRICLVSSGDEAGEQSGRLETQLTLLPHHLPCIVQIREKRLSTHELLRLAHRMKLLTLSKKVLLVINERVDIALAAALDGIHLPENGCSPMVLRPLAPTMLFGCSVHSFEASQVAEESGADYLIFGPIFDTPSKRPYGPPQGLEKLRRLCQSTTLPVFALGGVRPENAERCIAEGAYGVAALTLFMDTIRFIDTIEQLYHTVTP